MYVRTINIPQLMTVYGFSQERMTVKKTCMFEINLRE